MSDDVFERARRNITPGLIERLFSSQGSKWVSGQFFCLSPIRMDKHVGSFRINKDGLYYDSATGEGGDLIELYAKAKGIELKEAAQQIAGDMPGPEKKTAKKRESHGKPYYGFEYPTEDEIQKLGKDVRGEFWTSKFGKPVAGYRYSDQKGVRYVVARYEQEDGNKNYVPFYKCAKRKKFVSGLPDMVRIPYNLDKLLENPDSPVLVVEGEKCAQVQVEGWISTTWPGGTNSWGKVDWTFLEGRRVVFWPDADNPKENGLKPGLNAMIQLSEIVTGKIIDVYGIGFKDAEDIYDAREKGYLINEIIENGPFLPDEQPQIPENLDTETGEITEGQPPEPPEPATSGIDPSNVFRFLGYTDTAHYFMLVKDRIIVSISRGGFTSSRVLQLAPLSWWEMAGMVTNQGAIKLTFAQDYLQEESSRTGRFDDSKIRGTGVWRDGDEFILNTGEKLVFADGRECRYEEFKTRYFYVSSAVSFGPLGSEESTDEDGRSLHKLFEAHSWSGEMDHTIALGWALLAPMAGALNWRPHLWITGRFGSGKSHFIENLLNPTVGSFRHSGSAGDTESGIRRSIQNDPRPVILDEMKVKSQKDDDKIKAILSLARDASSNASATRTMAGRDGGTEQFTIRSPFCFGSDQPPAMDGAIESRIIKVEAHSPPKSGQVAFQERRKQETKKYIKAIKNPERYRLRIFRRLPKIMDDLEWLRDELLEILGSQRAADNYAPIFAFAWHIENSFSMRGSAIGKQFLQRLNKYFNAAQPTETETDEDALIYTILSHRLKVSYDNVMTVAECLTSLQQDAKDELSRIGIKRNGSELYIATKSDAINDMLRGTSFAGNYNAQLIRHELCTNQSGPGKLIRFKIGQKRARVFDYGRFVEQYLGDGEETDDS